MRLFILALALILLVAGCATQILEQERRKVEHQPVPYQDGYVDGCSTGTRAAGNPYFQLKKDVARFDADKFYAQGWNDGFNICKADYESITRRRY
jgi:hypothetical protein